MLLLALALVAAALGGGVTTASAAEAAAQVPDNVVPPLGGVESPATVPYRELVGAADARNLNAAVVDTSSYWVAAIDDEGHVIASQIPRPKAGSRLRAVRRPTPRAHRPGCPAPSSSPPTCARTAWPCSAPLPRPRAARA